ncbi:MAG: hypothetical protein H0U92_05150 [Actinobacteria bacterium]|nr:hypothetical protein [Actinomycetota bacterium]
MRLRQLLPVLSRTALAGVGVVAGIAIIASHLSSGSVAYAAETDLIATGAGQGGGAHVRTFGPDGTDGGVSYFSNGTPSSGATVAVGDVTGDGAPEIITGTGPGLEARVQVWNRDGKTLIAESTPFPGFKGGVNVAVGNVDDSAALEVIVAAGAGGGPHVKAQRFISGQLSDVFGFYAYDRAFTGGVFVAGAPGRIITGAGAGGGPHVRVFQTQGGAPTLANEWMAYGSFNGGVRVAAGVVRTDNVIDVVTAAGAGGGPHVKLWSIAGVEGDGFYAYDPTFRGGAFVAVANGKRIITGAGSGGGPHVKVITFANGDFSTNASFFAYAREFSGGVRVAGFPLTTNAPPRPPRPPRRRPPRPPRRPAPASRRFACPSSALARDLIGRPGGRLVTQRRVVAPTKELPLGVFAFLACLDKR